MKTARLFNCGLCRTLISICSCCDRGNIYCCDDCAQWARQISLRAAGKRYQNTYQGGLNHAARQKRYAARNKALQNQVINKVTHHGSNSLPNTISLSIQVTEPEDLLVKAISDNICCHFCARPCSNFLRRGFLVTCTSDKPAIKYSWPHGP